MFSLSKHIKTQTGNVLGTVQSIGNSSMKLASEVTGIPRQATPPPVTEQPKLKPIPKRDTQRGTRILSLDGGGVRGYSALIILDDFMIRLNKRRKLAGEEEVIPADFFDLIIGTSTGGIMALMLGRMRMNVRECIKSYETLSSKIFRGGVANTILSGGLLGNGPGLGLGMGVVNGRDLDNFLHMAMSSAVQGEPAMYDAPKLEKHVKRAITAQAYTWGNEDTMLEEPKDSENCYTAIVTACQTNAATPHLMRSYEHPDYPTSAKVKIWEAARATSAAPAFFAPIEIGDARISYVDGAVTGHCNPTTLAREEAECLWPDRRNVFLLSLGTGAASAINLSGQLSQKLIGFIGLSANAIQTAEAATRYYNQRYEKGCSPYVRISVPSDIDDVRMDDYQKMPLIASATATYLLKEDTMVQLAHAVDIALDPKKLQPKIRKGTSDEAPPAYPQETGSQ
ncbi:hypothetical protein FRC11_010462 [Ceratobasidium sp. 423]|nr:hypothetical protein FRC11_010462 [Ceratobasidium sp. 423]